MIEQAIRLTVSKLRRHCGLRLSPVWDLDDARQAAAVAWLETGDPFRAADLVWNEFQRDRWAWRKINPGLPSQLQAIDRRFDPIPDRYFAQCSDRERAALCLAYECGMDGDGIAENLNCTRKAANLLLVRGRKKVAVVA